MTKLSLFIHDCNSPKGKSAHSYFVLQPVKSLSYWKNILTMSVLPLHFALFQLIGLWRPINWSLGWKYISYHIYTFIVLFIIFASAFTEIVQLIGTYENLEKFLTSSTVLITMIGSCAKAVDVLDKRENLLKMVKALISSPCSPRDSEEQLIQNKYDRIIRFRSFAYMTLAGMSTGLASVEALLYDLPLQKLTYAAWYPMNLSIYSNYLVAWIHQNIAHMYAGLICADYDTFVSGFMLQSCAKFDILNYRLSNICRKIQNNSENYEFNNKKEYIERIVDCIKYHLTIIEFSRYTNETFSSIMFFQFSVSTGVICVTIFSLSHITASDPYLPVLIIYLTCILLQLFLFCYTGNEVTLKSADVAEAIYCNVDWWTTSVNVQKKLLFIMLRSTDLVTYTCGKIFELSIESYKNIVKFSYSAYNVLQQS